MIIVTGGAGFIGSAMVAGLNARGIDNILIVDHLVTDEKWKNLRNLSFADYVDKADFLEMIVNNKICSPIKAVFHFGANSSTTEMNAGYLMKNNYEYSKILGQWAADNKVRFIYASSAATYGSGSAGFVDDQTKLNTLSPLNPYGYSKQVFDLWVKHAGLFDKFVGLKFFNVFGPNEYHKGEMRSFVLRAFEQIQSVGKVKLFKSYKKEYGDGQQVRDFIYVKDVVEIALFFYENPSLAGLYNVGTGASRSWNDLVKAVFFAVDKKPNIQFVDMPDSIRYQYQYYTQADITKLRNIGYTKQLINLEAGAVDYVKNYLLKDDKYISKTLF